MTNNQVFLDVESHKERLKKISLLEVACNFKNSKMVTLAFELNYHSDAATHERH
jgi:hypothetical protein